MNEHVLRARQIADALDSPNPERTLHQQFYDEWKAWETEDPTRTMKAFDREIGRGNDYTGRIVRFATGSAPRSTPFSDGQADRAARQVLRERPEVIAEAVQQAPPETQARIAAALTPSQPPALGTAGEYARDPTPDPSDYEIDQLALDLARRARVLRDRVRRFGVRTMREPSDTLRDLDSAITDAGEARAAVIEHINEGVLP